MTELHSEIGIIGAGNVGMALAKAFTRQQQPVVLGVNTPSRHADSIAKLGAHARIASVDAVLAELDLLILAVPHAALASLAERRADWHNTILVDATNPLAPGLNGLIVGTHTSGAEQFAAAAHGARVVKAFNSTGAENMADAHYPQGRIVMPVCGDDAPAKQRVMALANLIGFAALDLGPLSAARYLEPFAMTWIHLAIKQGLGRQFAFSLMTR